MQQGQLCLTYILQDSVAILKVSVPHKHGKCGEEEAALAVEVGVEPVTVSVVT
jgi:hypothetical protein